MMIPVFAIGCAVLGAVLASFAGVIAERMHTGESFAHGRSRCNSCNRTLTARDLVPVVSWVIAKGRCRTCMARIPYGYALSEATLVMLFFMSALIIPVAHLPYFLAALFFLAIVVLYDLRHTIVPLPPTYLLIAASVLFAYVSAPDFHALISVFLTACCIALGFFLMHVLSKGRWMGLGDTPVAFALSLLAAPYAVAGLLFSFWIGAVIGIGILVATPKGHRMGIEVPFIPFLAAGYLLAFFTQWNPLPF